MAPTYRYPTHTLGEKKDNDVNATTKKCNTKKGGNGREIETGRGRERERRRWGEEGGGEDGENDCLRKVNKIVQPE